LPWTLLDCRLGRPAVVWNYSDDVLDELEACTGRAVHCSAAVAGDNRLSEKSLFECQRLARRTNSKITGRFSEGIMGVRTSKSFVREEQNLKEFQALSAEDVSVLGGQCALCRRVSADRDDDSAQRGGAVGSGAEAC
jgi:hypothetical protein